ncbi:MULTISPECIES: phage tail tape measure protein [Pseudomonas]|jgi:lambda family phage tail tape measure protein|uniref:Phage tail tape meausure protein, lambda family n=1 Tax=Pseudomonas putida (strain ATCC 47054 / DSM 6125 / CFBP 8728 / NCIMB 11950 / KT2440) TaxID=160488 RepID=Q88MJ4_PSEPK|nr:MULTISPECIES: phage tail tape measure C-terminal domain-containing protein [Pseudomonas]AAN67198.1 Phage tail tape meausure protein, lambda family [Pseudomonas putida KT2440]KMU95701.1 tail tape measure protein [Pseudomonas putida]KMY36384.1 tail tape measure protein [Pseudomonas putida]MDD2078574.1 tail tape measure protein [Pseudomonas putida]PXZ52428.1 tail tape measure protein [Pseudomonas sp. SMT-1]
MASRSLGTLTLDVIAQVGGFVAGMDKAERSSEKWRKQVEKNAKAVGTAVGAGLATGITAITAMTVSAINSASEITNLASVANVSTTDFQKLAVGAKTVGVEQDKLADILKDVNDKVGDFLNTGGGGMADFFEQVAPKVGVTADQFRNLSGSQALGLYVSTLEKAKVSQSDMTFYLEAIASDATALLPLLRNNSEGFKRFGDAAAAAGSIMDEKTIRAAQELKAANWLVEQSISGLGNQITSAMLPTLANFATRLSDTTINGVLAKRVSDDLAASFRALGKFAVGTVAGIHLLGVGLKTLSDVDNAMVGGDDAKWYDRYLPPVRIYNAFKNVDAIGKTISGAKAQMDGLATGYGSLIASFDEKPGQGSTNQIKELADLLARLREGQAGSFTALTTDQQAAAKAAEAAAKKLLGQFDTAEEGYKRQIALINTETDKRKEATEVAKLQFELESGNLAGLSAKQQERLKGLAAELDQLKKLKQAKEDDKEVAGFDASVKRQLDIDQRALDAPLLNAYSTDEMKQRVLDLLAIEQDYQDQLEDLRQRHEAGDVSDSVYERETEILSDALEKRRAMQEKYYQDVDAMQQNGTAGFISGFATQAEAAMDLYSNMQSVGSAAFSSLTDMLTEWAETGKLNAKDFAATFIQSIGHSLLAYAAAQVAMAGLNAFTAMIGVPFVGPAIAPGAAIAAAAAAGVLMTGVGSALSGQAHGGMENIPREGTWLLDGGERVLSPAQNRDLTGYLQRANSVDATSKPGGGAMNVEVHNYAPAQVDVQQDGDRMKVFIREAKKQIAGDLARGNGDVSKALSQGWGVKRAAR